MNNNQKRVFGITLAIKLIVIVGITLVFYSVAVDNIVSSPQQENTLIPVAQLAGKGQTIFEEKCIACHIIGGGRLVGPDLYGVTVRREPDWLTRWIREPDQMLAEGDPLATNMFRIFENVAMPNMGLSEAEVAAVIAYLKTAPPSQTTVPDPPLPEGDPVYGKALFTGAVRLQRGSTPCISCHHIPGLGPFGGGIMAPDLTHIYSLYGENGLATTLRNQESMFFSQPFVDDEIAHLIAYFGQVEEKPAEPVNFNFVLMGLGGFIILSLFKHSIWNKYLIKENAV